MEATQCPLINKWVSKILYIYTIEYYSALKRSEILTYAVTEMNVEDIMLSEMSVTKRQILYDSTYMRYLKCLTF